MKVYCCYCEEKNMEVNERGTGKCPVCGAIRVICEKEWGGCGRFMQYPKGEAVGSLCGYCAYLLDPRY